VKEELNQQYGHTWRVLARVVKDFEPDAWIHAGRGTILPVRIAFHMVQSVTYYIGSSSPLLLVGGKPFDGDWDSVTEADLPTQQEIVSALDAMGAGVESWLCDIDLDAENKAFGWAGATQFGVVLFLLRHTLYHLGQLSALLEESRDGKAADHFVEALS
jgi:hypothetical protein